MMLGKRRVFFAFPLLLRGLINVFRGHANQALRRVAAFVIRKRILMRPDVQTRFFQHGAVVRQRREMLFQRAFERRKIRFDLAHFISPNPQVILPRANLFLPGDMVLVRRQVTGSVYDNTSRFSNVPLDGHCLIPGRSRRVTRPRLW